MVRIVDSGDRRIEAFNARPAFPEEAERAAAAALAEIRARGDAAVVELVAKFEGFRAPRASALRVDISKVSEQGLDAKLVKAVKDAHRRVLKFSKASLREAWSMPSPRGGRLGEFYSPMDRVGVYVPGGTAPLASTSVMTVTLAKAAGVKEIVACTPAGRDGKVNPVLLYALKLAGATEVYRVGGIQAIGMMAFGTRTCRKVQKIAGPGNAFVTAAKRQVYGYVAIDQVAGPSEIAVLADGSVDARWIAADLLSQAEHGSGWEKSLCVATSRKFAEKVRDEVLMTKDALKVMKGVRSAGAVFAGPWTPESAGDFVAGPSHVLPTGGAANMFNGLTPDDFRRRHSFVAFTRGDLAETAPTIAAFAAVEGLDGHGRAASIRFEKQGKSAKRR